MSISNRVLRELLAKGKISDSNRDPWETGELGVDEAFVKVTDAAEAAETDDALGLKMISIRLQNDLIDKLKLIAKYHGTGYQPLMRNALQIFARDELLRIAAELDERKNLEQIANALDTQNKITSTKLEKLAQSAKIHDVMSPAEEPFET